MERIKVLLGILVFIILISFGFVFLVKNTKKSYHYTIRQDSHTYQTDYFTKDTNGCINFLGGCGCSGKKDNVTICGNYSIITNNNFGN